MTVLSDDEILTYELIGVRAMNMVRNWNKTFHMLSHEYSDIPKTVGDLRKLPDYRLLSVPNFGRKSLIDLRKLLKND